jgi:hypothetical protein
MDWPSKLAVEGRYTLVSVSLKENRTQLAKASFLHYSFF